MLVKVCTAEIQMICRIRSSPPNWYTYMCSAISRCTIITFQRGNGGRGRLSL